MNIIGNLSSLFRTRLHPNQAYKTTVKMEEEYPEEEVAFLKKVNENMKSAKAAKKADEQFQKIYQPYL